MSPPHVIVGGHPWVYAATQPACDIYPILDGIFADMAAAGLDGIELMDSALEPDGAVERVRELSRRYDLPVIGASSTGPMWDRSRHDDLAARAERLLPRLAAVGGRTFGVTVGSPGGRKTREHLDAQTELLARLMELCGRHGVQLNMHNHAYEVEDELYDLRGTLERLPGLMLGPDLDWLVRGGVDPVWLIRTFADRIVFLHLRDQGTGGEWVEAMGDGDMDYVAIGDALHAIGYSGPLIIELAHAGGFVPARTLAEDLRLSREYVRRTMGY